MTTPDDLPPLPEPAHGIYSFSADQMRAYARQARAAAPAAQPQSVPSEATLPMLEAYSRVVKAGSDLDGAMVWRCMLAAAPLQPAAEQSLNMQMQMQMMCSGWNAYWRASDAHGVDLTQEQALELLRFALGVEVEIKAAPAQPLKARPDFIAGYDAGLDDGKRMLERYIAEQEASPYGLDAAPAPKEWTDAKLRGIASDYFRDAKDWPAAMLCMRHLLMEQVAAPAQPAEPPSDPLHDDAYLRGIALGFPVGDKRRWVLCRIADRIEASPPQPQLQPLTDAQIMDAFLVTPGIYQFVTAFKAGARWAESVLAAQEQKL